MNKQALWMPAARNSAEKARNKKAYSDWERKEKEMRGNLLSMADYERIIKDTKGLTKKASLEEIYSLAFKDELEKIAISEKLVSKAIKKRIGKRYSILDQYISSTGKSNHRSKNLPLVNAVREMFPKKKP